MTQRDPGVYLEDIEYCANAAVRFMSGYTLDKVYDIAVRHTPELLIAVRNALKAFP